MVNWEPQNSLGNLSKHLGVPSLDLGKNLSKTQFGISLGQGLEGVLSDFYENLKFEIDIGLIKGLEMI